MTITREETRTFKKSRNVALDRRGVDAWGLYAAYASSYNEVRVFVVGKLICVYRRQFTSARTTWKAMPWPTTEAALTYFTKSAGSSTVIVGAPVLVQLTDSDVELIRAGKMPNARYRGQARHEALYGKIDDSTLGSLGSAVLAPGTLDALTAVAALRVTPAASTPTVISGGVTALSPSTVAAILGGETVGGEPVGDEPF